MESSVLGQVEQVGQAEQAEQDARSCVPFPIKGSGWICQAAGVRARVGGLEQPV